MSTGPNSWKSKSELRCVVDMHEILVEKKLVASPLCPEMLYCNIEFNFACNYFKLTFLYNLNPLEIYMACDGKDLNDI